MAKAVARESRNLYRRVIGSAIMAIGLTACVSHDMRAQGGTGTMPAKPIEAVLKSYTDVLMAVPGVVGTAQALCGGRDCIKVYVIKKTPQLAGKIPDALEGYPVAIEEVGEFRALPEQH